jgi:hypothetical protein
MFSLTKLNLALLLAVEAIKLRTGGGSLSAKTALETREEVHVGDCSKETGGCDTVMFIHYHKTGCVLSRELLDLFFNGNGKAMLRAMEGPLGKRNGGSCPSLVRLTEHKQLVMEAPDLNECTVGSTFPADTKVVHFVRDPYKMAVSGYVYHTEGLTPEMWVLEKLPTCGNATQVPIMSQALGLDIEPVRHLYETLYEKFARRSPRAPNFYQDLKGLDRVDGLRLWTSFAICSDMEQAGGDLVRMPFNAQWLAKNKMGVHTIYMDDWIGHTQAEFSGLYDFLGITSLPRDINKVKPQNIFHPARQDKVHVTQAKISEREKDQLIAALRADSVLRPFLDLMHKPK